MSWLFHVKSKVNENRGMRIRWKGTSLQDSVYGKSDSCTVASYVSYLDVNDVKSFFFIL